jgi:hypothetical protein
MDRIPTLEIAVWALAAVLAAGAMLAWKPFPLSNDGIVYLNVAENLRNGHGVSTTIIHYDTERSHGRIPAPMTSFPPGYPFVLWLSGLSERSGRIVSIASFAGTAAMLAWILLLTRVPLRPRVLAMTILLTNVVSVRFATGILTEPLFTLLTLSALVGLTRADALVRGRRFKDIAIVLSCLAIGLAYTIRYAGLFLVLPVIAFALYLAAVTRRWRPALATFIPLSIAAAVMLRNSLAVGDWRGGNDMEIVKPWRALIQEYARGQLHLLLGFHRTQIGVWEGILIAATILVVVRLSFAPMQTKDEWREPALVTLWILIYTAAFFYAARNSVVDLDSRMFVPMVPCYLLLLGMLLRRWPQSPTLASGGLLLTIAVCYAAANARDLYMPDPPPRPEILSGLLAQPAADGRPLRTWIDTNIGADEVLLAPDGQVTAHLLLRPVLSMVPAVYSPIRWECGEIRKQMERFRVRYLFVYLPLPPGSPENEDFLLTESRFLAGSVEQQEACGFTVAAANPAVRILRLARTP